QSRSLQSLLRTRHRTNPHDARLHSHSCPRNNPPNRFQTAFFRNLLSCHHNRRRTVHNPARVPRRHNPIFLERRRQLLQNFHRRLRPPVIVFAHQNRFLPLLHLNRSKLLFHPASLMSRLRELLAPQRITIRVPPRNAVLLRQFFRSQRHRQSAIRIRQSHHQR